MGDKIVLGTVQLGLPYGINNQAGQPSRQEAFDILDFAFQQGIHTLDSADGYGEALQVVGEYEKLHHRNFRIINKFKFDQEPLKEKLNRSLQKLGTSSLSCYMYHSFDDYAAGSYRRELLDFRERGHIGAIGVSLYDSAQLAKVVNDREISIIQLPVNLLDLSDEKVDLLQQAKSNHTEVHARSVFLQGIFFRDPATLTGNLTALKPYIEQLQARARETGRNLNAVTLNFVLNKKYIDKVVVGVDHVTQLASNLEAIDSHFRDADWMRIAVKDEHLYLLNPGNWKP